MINYFEWSKRRLSVTSLRLDISNPRLTRYGKVPTQPEIIEYLIKNEKVIELAKSIINQGYFLNEQPIVCREKGKHIVLEGNRRVAACKIILNPDLIKNKNKRTQIAKATENFDIDIIKKLEVYVAPSREDADIMIVNRHTGGSVVEKWDKTKQDRFLHNRFNAGESIDEMANKFGMSKGDIREALKRYNVFNDITNLNLSAKQKDILTEETKFNMTNVERVYTSKHGRDFLGIEFDENGKIIRKLPPVEYNNRLQKVVEDVIDGIINSRTLNTEKEKREYIDSILSENTFDITITPSKKYNEQYIEKESEPEFEEKEKEADKEGGKKVLRPTPENKLFSPDLEFVTHISRIDEIFLELKKLNLKTNPNAVAVLLRSYIDMLSYQYLYINKKNGLSQLLKDEGVKMNVENDKKVVAIRNYIETLGVKPEKIKEDILKKVLKIRGGVNKDFIPSLRYMLVFISKADLIEDKKLKQALESYLRKGDKTDKVIGHNEFNLLVHNEYYTNDKDDLKSAWRKLEPFLAYMVNHISNNNGK